MSVNGVETEAAQGAGLDAPNACVVRLVVLHG